MAILKNILSQSTGELVEKAGKVIDQFVTTKEERLAAKNEFAKIMTDWANNMQSQLTERLRIDMASDSWLSKNIRPLTLIFILGMYSVLSLLDGNIFGVEINDAYIELLGEWGRMIFIFYFGGRTFEKTTEIIQKFKTERQKKSINR